MEEQGKQLRINKKAKYNRLKNILTHLLIKRIVLCFQIKKKYLRRFTPKDLKKRRLSKKNNYYFDLKYYIHSSKKEFDFSESKDHIIFLDSIKEGKLTLEETENQQNELEKCLGSIIIGNKD